jgi:hypothetical protein
MISKQFVATDFGASSFFRPGWHQNYRKNSKQWGHNDEIFGLRKANPVNAVRILSLLIRHEESVRLAIQGQQNEIIS